MLIKEFQTPLPLSVDEYKIGQAYMFNKKIVTELKDFDGGVKLEEDKLFDDELYGTGRYTKKVYSINKMIPAFLSAIIPASANVVEEIWNTYPFVKSVFSCSHASKLRIETFTHYLPHIPTTVENNLFSDDEDYKKANVVADLVDIVQNKLPAKVYKTSEDPSTYICKKTGVGPLTADWIKLASSVDSPFKNFMYSYKLVKVYFEYFGFQTSGERYFMNETRNKILLAHRQVWAWQDEWQGMTFEEADKPIIN